MDFTKTTHQYAAYKRLTSELKTHRLKVTTWERYFVFHMNGKDKKAGVAILISDKTDFLKSYSNRPKKSIIL